MTIVNKKVLFFYYWLPMALWMGLIFYFSSLPSSSIPQRVPDYVAHSFEYSVLSLLLYRALKNSFSLEKVLFKLSFSLAILYAVSDEVHQYWVPSRTPSLIDLAVDSLAVFLTLMLVRR